VHCHDSHFVEFTDTIRGVTCSFSVITSSCIAQYMFYIGSDSFTGTTPSMQLIEELRADRERVDRIEEHLKQR
jgi:hypothetical protein